MKVTFKTKQQLLKEGWVEDRFGNISHDTYAVTFMGRLLDRLGLTFEGHYELTDSGERRVKQVGSIYSWPLYVFSKLEPDVMIFNKWNPEKDQSEPVKMTLEEAVRSPSGINMIQLGLELLNERRLELRLPAYKLNEETGTLDEV